MYKFIGKLCCILLLAVILGGLASACSRKNNFPEALEQVEENEEVAVEAAAGAEEAKTGTETETESMAVKTVEDELTAWIESSKNIFLAQSRELEGKQYFLVTYGRKNGSGYAVEITEVEILEDRVQVRVTFNRPPQNGDHAGTAVTYPYALESIDATGLPVEFIAEGAEEYVPQLLEIDYVKPIVAQSEGIKIFSPAPGTQVGRRFTVAGIANVFEGNFQYKLTDSFGKTFLAGYSTAAMGDWKYFSLELEVDEKLPVGSPLQLVLFTQSPKDGSIGEQVVLELPFAEI